MAKIGVIAFSEKGKLLGSFLLHRLEEEGHSVQGYVPGKYAGDKMKAFTDFHQISGTLFEEKDIVIFIGACGIAVRAIAPHIKNKMEDPGVLVLDECGKYVISLLSGHVGGANEFARRVGKMVGAEPVITTATDRNGLFAVDDWAVKNSLHIWEPASVKEISSRILAGEKVGFLSHIPVKGNLPGQLTMEHAEAGIAVCYDRDGQYFPITCRLVPMDLVVGMGCRRDKSYAELDSFLHLVFQERGLETERIGLLCSIDVKGKEEGLQKLAKAFRVGLQTFSASELSKAAGNFTASAFVEKQVGVDNVCERSASLGSGGGRRLVAKQTGDGMTLAVYQREVILQFSETDRA